jgi:hypothetical protein
MAALSIANGTFLAATTCTVRPYSGDDRMLRGLMPPLAAITSGAATAAGACTLAHASILPGETVSVEGLAPDGVATRRVFAYGA